MNRYEKKEPLPIESCPLAWWKKNEIEFPLLSVVAKEILSIPASSAPSERVFSKLGRLYTKERLSMSGDLADACLFLSFNGNLEVVKVQD